MNNTHQRVNFYDLDFGDSQLFQMGAMYKGNPFTGTAHEYELDGKIYFEYNYLEGKAHGRWYCISNENNQLLYDEWYIHGIEHGEFKEWDDIGNPTCFTKYDSGTIEVQQYWNNSRILVKFIDRAANVNEEYYEDGSLYLRIKEPQAGYIGNQTQWFLGAEEKWLATNLGYEPQKETFEYIFNSDLIMAHLDELSAQFHHLVVIWFAKHLIRNDQDLALEFLTKLTGHKDGWFRSESAAFLGELGDKRAIPFLKRLLPETARPFNKERFNSGGSGHTKSIGQRAKLAIKTIERSEGFWQLWGKAT